jgi:hypothetical protein
MVYILTIKLFKPVDTKKDDWDQGSLFFLFRLSPKSRDVINMSNVIYKNQSNVKCLPILYATKNRGWTQMLWEVKQFLLH